MHTPLTLAKIEELRLTRSTSEVEQHAARLALAACLKGALQGALVSTPGTVTRPDAAAGVPQRAYGDENASPLPNQDFPQPHWPKCAAFPSSCYAPEKEFCSGWGPVVGQPGQGRCADDNDRVHGDVNDGVRDGDDGSSDSSAESQSTAWAEAFEHPECLDVLRGLSPVDLSPLRFAHATRDDPTFLAGAATGSPGCSSASSCDVAGDLGMPLVGDASPVKYPSGRHPAERPPAEFVAEDCSADRALPGGVACHPLHPQPELQKKVGPLSVHVCCGAPAVFLGLCRYCKDRATPLLCENRSWRVTVGSSALPLCPSLGSPSVVRLPSVYSCMCKLSRGHVSSRCRGGGACVDRCASLYVHL